jgi:hypothetical protein
MHKQAIQTPFDVAVRMEHYRLLMLAALHASSASPLFHFQVCLLPPARRFDKLSQAGLATATCTAELQTARIGESSSR